MKKSFIDFNLSDFINDFGGIENIEFTKSTINSLIIKVKEKITLPIDFKEHYKVKGIIVSDKKYTLLIGNNSTYINDLIKQQINK